MYEYLDKRYALALYEVAKEKNKVDEYLQDLREICSIIEDDKDFYEVVKHPQITTRNKKRTFINIFKGKIDEELLSFLLILIEKDRILFLREKLIEMEKIVLEARNILPALVRTAVPLDKEEEETLRKTLEKKYNKHITINCEVDKSLLGGVFLRVGNEVIDGTIKSKLEEMKNIMLRRE